MSGTASPLSTQTSNAVLQAGRRVFERFDLISLVGRGGMGVVWKAQDSRLDRVIALKFLPDVCFLDAAARDDLKRETRHCLDLTHPHIVRIHDFVEDEAMAAIVMEYVDGLTMSQLRVNKPSRHFEPDELAMWTTALCSALTYAHESGHCVHRDLKPGNLMVNSRGVLKVTDFGIACSLQHTAARMSAWSSTGGTLGYMSPQQLLGELASASDDIYSVGATLYELLTGRPPFYSGDVTAQVREIIPDTVTERRQKLGLPCMSPFPPAWEETIADCLAKDPRKRPASASEIARRLGLACAPLAETSAPMGETLNATIVGTNEPTVGRKPPPLDWESVKAWARVPEKRPALLGAAAVLFLTVSFLAWKTAQRTTATPAPPAVVQNQVIPPALPTVSAPATPPPIPLALAPVAPQPLTDDHRALLAPIPPLEKTETTAPAPAAVTTCQVTLETTPRGIPFQILASAYETPVAEVLQSGETPAVIPLPPGTYRVVYSPAGLQSRSVTIPILTTEKATFLQQFPHGLVKIHTQPEGAAVICDGRDIGTSPLEVDLLPGAHDISAESNGRTSRTRHIQLADAAEQTVAIDFRTSTASSSSGRSRRSKPKEDDTMLTKIGRSIKTIFTGEKPKKR
ncbi:MAG: protein kinase [Chthoniobacter sp.]|uniref:serine/threonine-protein kinase n=1 Tax=Chthoniobacter sp. TaxID=2510640 RepID=UPI0032A52937